MVENVEKLDRWKTLERHRLRIALVHSKGECALLIIFTVIQFGKNELELCGMG
jgi:hypothetical protein